MKPVYMIYDRTGNHKREPYTTMEQFTIKPEQIENAERTLQACMHSQKEHGFLEAVNLCRNLKTLLQSRLTSIFITPCCRTVVPLDGHTVGVERTWLNRRCSCGQLYSITFKVKQDQKWKVQVRTFTGEWTDVYFVGASAGGEDKVTAASRAASLLNSRIVEV